MLSKKQVGYVLVCKCDPYSDCEPKKVFKDRQNSSYVEEFFVNKRISSNSHNKLVLI